MRAPCPPKERAVRVALYLLLVLYSWLIIVRGLLSLGRGRATGRPDRLQAAWSE